MLFSIKLRKLSRRGCRSIGLLKKIAIQTLANNPAGASNLLIKQVCDGQQNPTLMVVKTNSTPALLPGCGNRPQYSRLRHGENGAGAVGSSAGPISVES